MSQYEKLVIGAAPEPEFTRQQVKQKGTHVNKEWWAKCLTYDQVMEKTQRSHDDREDLLVPSSKIRAVVDNGIMKFEVDGRKYNPTDYAIRQFSVNRIPSSTILRELRAQEDFDDTDAQIMAALANNALRRIDSEKKFRIRTYRNDNTMRAFLTESYAPIDNRWYLEQLREFIPDGVFSHWRGDDDTICGNILIPDTVMDYEGSDDSDYGGMISIGNCEIGRRRLTQAPSVFRSICWNGNIWGRVEGKAINRRHIGSINLEEIKVSIAENIQYQMPLLSEHIVKFLATQKLTTENVPMIKVLAAVVQDTGITKSQGGEVWKQYDKHESEFNSLFGIINAITRAGQEFDDQTYVKLDYLAGELTGMTPERWNKTLKRADSFDAKQIESILSVAV